MEKQQKMLKRTHRFTVVLYDDEIDLFFERCAVEKRGDANLGRFAIYQYCLEKKLINLPQGESEEPTAHFPDSEPSLQRDVNG